MDKKIISEIKKGTWWQGKAGGEFQLYFYPAWGFSRMKEFYPDLDYWAVAFSHRKEHITQFMKEEDSLNFTGYFLKLYKKDQKKFLKLIKEWEIDVRKMFKWLKKYSSRSLSSLNNQELYEAFSEFGMKISEIWGRSLVIEGNGIYFEKILIPKLEKATKLERGVLSSKVSVLTAPLESSFFSEEKQGTLELAANLKKLKIDPRKNIKEIEKRYPAFLRKLVSHQEKYFWLENDYNDSKIIPLTQFFKKVREVLRKKPISEIKQEIDELRTRKSLLKEKAKIKKELGISQELLGEIDFFRILGEWQDQRKKMNLRSGHFLTLFIKEISKRIGIDYRLGYSLLEGEIRDFLLSGKNPSPKKLESRRKFFLILLYSNRQIGIIENKKEALFYENLFKEHSSLESSDKKELSGIVASTGKNARVSGSVRVIINAENQDIKKGEILVSSMTRPEFFPLMKKAKAVVTDEGGITSHAAIVSRELGITCIIGTKIATQVLKDGDLVEVDAEKGVVRILKRAKIVE